MSDIAGGKADISHIEGLVESKVDIVTEEARERTKFEHDMTIWQALRAYPKAVAWSIILSATLIMEGCDLVLLGSLYALPPFQKKYGQAIGNGQYQLSAPWQAGLSNGATIGEMTGLFISGIAAEKIGYRKTLIGALITLTGFIFIAFFSQTIVMLEVAEILMGISWGVFQTLTATYACEVVPVVLRYFMTSYITICWLAGQLIGSGIMKGFSMSNINDEWAYRIPFALQWIWPVPLMIGIYCAPESPWWLVRKGRHEEAKKSYKRLLSSKNPDFEAEQAVAMMIHTNQLEQDMVAGVSYFDLFKGPNLRRTEIACMAFTIPALSGSVLEAYSTYFYEQAGIDTSLAFSLSVIQYALGIVATALSWFIARVVGRRTFYLYGMLTLMTVLLIIGFLSVVHTTTSISLAIGSMLFIHGFVYCMTLSSSYTVVTEAPSRRLGIKTIVVARNLYNLVNIVIAVINPYMLNPTAWNWKGKTGFFWAGSCLICFIWCFFRLPETKNRTYGELDYLFRMNIPARKFKTTRVDLFESDDDDVKIIVTDRKT